MFRQAFAVGLLILAALGILAPATAEEHRAPGGERRAASGEKTTTGGTKQITNSIGMKLKLIPAGEFQMGSNEEDDEKPVHRVKITKAFYMGIHEVADG